jgi:HTH-type transcriptional regulator/antitoxin HipB
MKTLKRHLNEKLKDPNFKAMYEEEKRLIEISLMLHEAREKNGLSQKEVAQKAHITQQQLSKVENGINCNIITFLKVCNALGLDISINRLKSAKNNA